MPTKGLPTQRSGISHTFLRKVTSLNVHLDRLQSLSSAQNAHLCGFAPTSNSRPLFRCQPHCPLKRTCLCILKPVFNSIFERIRMLCLLINFLDGITHRLRIGYAGPSFPRCTKNALTAAQHPDVVAEYILKEISLSHTVGPFPAPPFLSFVCSSLGVRPKKTGSHRLIMNLSRPFGQSVNDSILKNDFPLVFCTFDDAVWLVTEAGTGALMGKMDVRYAFRLMPVHPLDWELLGFEHRGQYFFDTVLPFGLLSSPSIFCQ